MNIRIEQFGIRFHLGINRTVKVLGVNSALKDGHHLVLWDFDDIDLEQIVKELRDVQFKFNLPEITVLSTGIPRYHHAYCFAARNLTEVHEIILKTPSTDKVFAAFGVMRGYYTLRISKKRGREFIPAYKLPSIHDKECSASEVANFSKYDTRRR